MTELSVESSSKDTSPDEPKLKYQRMVNDVDDLLLREVISCVAIHTKFICIGSTWGKVYIVDHEGNFVSKLPGCMKTGGEYFHAHTIAVNHISVDLSGDHIVTCSDDGKVNIHGLYSSENNSSLSLGRVIKTVALDPNFKSATGSRFVIGDNKLILYEKSFFNRVKSTVLFQSESYVSAIAWQDRFIAWAGDVCVRVYDVTARCSLGLISWDTTKSVPIESCRCNILWSAENTLMIGWVDRVRIFHVRKRRGEELVNKGTPEYLVEPMYTFQINYFVCGLAPLDYYLIVLGASKELDESGKGQRPTVNILDYKASEYFEISSDSLNVRGYQGYLSNNYHLACVPEENRFYIVAPNDIIIANQYDVDDKVQWLVEHDFYEKAINLLKEAGGRTSKYTMSSIGVLHMDRLIQKKEFEQAALIYSEVCNIDPSLWEREIYKFVNEKAFCYITPYIPTSVDKKLSPQIYERILYENLKPHPKELLRLVQIWDPSLYTVNTIIKAVIAHMFINDNDKSTYIEILAILNCYQGKYDQSLSMYLKLQHKDVFKLIKKHNLYNFIHNKILALMKLDCDKAIAMLLDKAIVPVEVIEEQLKENDYYLYKYLDALCKVNSTGKFHGTLVKLYAHYGREKLLPFLICSDSYPIQDALDVCRTRNFYPETVYLLGRIGSTKEALGIIIEKLEDINQAISFCQEHDDIELWMDLINHSLDKPQFITLLLKRIGNYVDPRVLIYGIPSGCEIVDLKDSLGKMMRDFNLQLSAQEACKAITFRNYFDLHNKLVKKHNKGFCISDEYMCSACHEKIFTKDLSHSGDMVVFNCKHMFHMSCLPKVFHRDICALCNPVKID